MTQSADPSSPLFLERVPRKLRAGPRECALTVELAHKRLFKLSQQENKMQL